mmetsp:Transcript_113103/g.326781  ORF Transcript_113103/g.326781 Transcript_113103/m.326781 type:complete len:221 (-) Transcript_113103:888-1550(-)
MPGMGLGIGRCQVSGPAEPDKLCEKFPCPSSSRNSSSRLTRPMSKGSMRPSRQPSKKRRIVPASNKLPHTKYAPRARSMIKPEPVSFWAPLLNMSSVNSVSGTIFVLGLKDISVHKPSECACSAFGSSAEKAPTDASGAPRNGTSAPDLTAGPPGFVSLLSFRSKSESWLKRSRMSCSAASTSAVCCWCISCQRRCWRSAVASKQQNWFRMCVALFAAVV